MAESGFLLKITKKDYQDKIGLIEQQMDALNGILGEYQTLLGQLDDVMERTSDQFQQTEKDVQANIDSVRVSLNNATNARDAVKAAVDAYDELGQNAVNTLQAGAEAAVSATKAAIKVASIID